MMKKGSLLLAFCLSAVLPLAAWGQNESFEVDCDTDHSFSFTGGNEKDPHVSEAIATGEYYVALNSIHGATSSDQMIVIKYDSDNLTVWKKQFGAFGLPGYYSYTPIVPHDITSTQDGGCVITGTFLNANSAFANDWDMFVMKISGTGAQQWFMAYSGTVSTQAAWDEGNAVIETIDPATGNADGYMVVGGVDGMADWHQCQSIEYGQNANTVKLAIVRLGLTGNVPWEYTFNPLRLSCDGQDLHHWMRGVDVIQIDHNDDGALENEYMLLAEYEDEVPKQPSANPVCNPCAIYRNPMLMRFIDLGNLAGFPQRPEYYSTALPNTRRFIHPKSVHEIPNSMLVGPARYIVSGYTHHAWTVNEPPFIEQREDIILFQVDNVLAPGASILHNRNNFDRLNESRFEGTLIHYAGYTIEGGIKKAVTGVANALSLFPLSNHSYNKDTDAEFNSLAFGSPEARYAGITGNTTDDLLVLSRAEECHCMLETPFTQTPHPLTSDHVDIDSVHGHPSYPQNPSVDAVTEQDQKCYTCPDNGPVMERFQTNYGIYGERGYGITQLWNDDYFAVGFSFDNVSNPALANYDGLFVRTNTTGALQAQGRIYESGQTYDEAFTDVVACDATGQKYGIGYIVYGEDGQSLRDTNGYVVVIHNTDVPLYSESYGVNSVACTTGCATRHDVFLRGLMASNSSGVDCSYLVMAGHSRLHTQNDRDGYIVKADYTATIGSPGTWGSLYGNSGVQIIYDIIQTDDNLDGSANEGYLAVGYSDDHWGGTVSVGTRAIWLLKLAPNGNVVWSNIYHTSEQVSGVAVTATDDDIDGVEDGFMIVGNYTDGSNNTSIVVMKTDLSGTLLWSKRLSRSDNDLATDIVATGHGTYLVTGETHTTTHQVQGYVLLLSNCGEILRNWDYPDVTISDPNSSMSEEDHLQKVIATLDGGFAAVGSTCSYGGTGLAAKEGDLWIVKMDCEGLSCKEHDPDEGDYALSLTTTSVTSKVERTVYNTFEEGDPTIDEELNENQICTEESGTPPPAFKNGPPIKQEKTSPDIDLSDNR